MFNAIPIKISMTFIIGIKKINPNIHLVAQKTINIQGNAELKENIGGITISDFKLYYRAIAIKTAW
jgi:hypothetical protein